MRLPFFRSPKVEPAKAVIAPPSPKPATNLQLVETQVITSTAVVEQPPAASSSPRADGPRLPATNGQTIPVALSSISQQLPANFLAAIPSGDVGCVTVNIPAEWVIPQLAKGRVTVTLADLLPLLPQNLVSRPFPAGNSQHAIVLPLADMVTALPIDLLQHQNQTEVDLDAPEFAQFPNLIDDGIESFAAEQAVRAEDTAAVTLEQKVSSYVVSPRSTETTLPPSAIPAPITDETSHPSVLAPTMAKPIPAAGSLPPQPVATPTPSNGNEITVSLRSLVAVMPDQYFVCPRTELWRRIDLDRRIALPADLVVPQLKVARVRLPLAVAIGLMPRSILASPLPSIAEETIPIALQEIVSQLPQNLFASQSKPSDLHEIDFSNSDIPTPFAEKNFSPATIEIRAPETAQPRPVRMPGETDTAPEPIEIASGALEVEGSSIFAEKSAASEPVASQHAPTPETVTEAPVAAPEEEVTAPTTAEAATEEPAPVEEAPPEAVAEAALSVPAASEQPASTETPKPVETSPVAAEATAEATAPVAETPAPTPTFESEPAVPEVVPEAQAPEPTAVTPSAEPASDRFLVNLNNCTVADLARIEGIGPVLAQRIIEFRNSRGGFKSLDDLHEVPGIGRKLLRALAGPARRGLNRLLGVEHNDELTLQEIVRLTGRLKGVAGCILAMSDGVFLTGELPPHLDQETISVFAPQLFRKVGRYMKELRAGQITRLSVFTDQQPLSIFRAHDIFLIVVHDNRHFSKALLRRCERISQELARLCHQRAVV